MKKNIRSLLAVIMSICMLLTLTPLSVFAEEGRNICFETDSFVENTAIFDVDGASVELHVNSANIVNGTVYLDDGDINAITLVITGDFDSDTMHVFVRGINNYCGEATVAADGLVSFDGLILPDGELRIGIESDNGGNDDWEEPHTIHFKDATVVDSDTVVFGEGNDAITMNIYNAEITDGVIHTDWASEVYGIQFELSSNFDSSTMKVYALALDGYTGELFIDGNNTASFVNPEDEEERLNFPEEIYISLDDYIMYAVAVDSYGNHYLDGETLHLEQGKSVFLCMFTHEDNVDHGVFFAVGFNYGVAGEGNFADSLTSMGFTVQEGNAEDFGYTDDWLQGCYGCLVTAPADMQLGTTGRVTYSLYELPDNFTWADPWNGFSWSDSPRVLDNNLYVEVREPWELYCNATVYTQGGFEKTVYDGRTLYLDKNEKMFIQVNSDYELNDIYGITNFYTFNFNEVQNDGFNVWFDDAVNHGFPDVGFGICIEPNNDKQYGESTMLRFGVHELPDNENEDINYDNPAAKCWLNVEVRRYDPCIYMVDQYGMIYNDGDSIFFDEDETKAIAFRTDIRNADNGYYQDYIGWDTDVLENAGFTIIDAGPAVFFDDYRDDFWADDFIIIVSAESLNYGTRVDYNTWLYENPYPDDFDWGTTPTAYEVSFKFRVDPLYGETGDCFWSYGDKTLEIGGDGAMADYGMIPGANEPVPSPWNGYDFETVNIGDGVTHISQDAFIFSNVREVEIADTVTSIGSNAFNGCGNLRTVQLPSGLTSIGNYAFASTGMHEIEIPASVTSIGEKAVGYYYDEDLQDDALVDGFAIYGYAGTAAETYANANNITFYDNTVYTSQDGLWKYCILPDNSARLYSDVAWGYSYQGNDTVVTIPSSIDGHTVTSLGACSMSNLTFITKIIVPDTVTEIGFSAFSGDTSLAELDLPDSIEVIGAQTLIDTALANDSQNYRDGGLYIDNYLILAEQNYQGDMNIEDGTSLIAMAAFVNCEVERIFIPKGVAEISDSMCYGCQNLREVGIPDSVTRIGFSAFANCPSLRDISIPASVEIIENGNFIYSDNNGEYVTLERIFGFEGTYAEQYANELGVEFVNMSSGTTGDCTWEYDIDSKTVTISGSGAMEDYGMVIPNSTEIVDAPWKGLDIQRVVIEDGVTHISQDAFINSGVYELDIADSVTSIGTNAFNGCGGLDYAELPQGLESIGAYAFYGTSMREVEIPAGVTSIGQCAFGFYYDWDNDRDARNDDFIVYGYGDGAAKDYADTNGFQFVDNTVYLSRDGLWEYSLLPDGTAQLTSSTPWGHSYQGNATVISIPSTIDGYTVTVLGACSMGTLPDVTSITVPNTVTEIGFSAFSGDTSLTELILPDTIIIIGAQVIDNTALVNNRANYVGGCLYVGNYLLRVDMNYSGTVIVRPGTTVMGMFSFGNCSQVERVILPDSLTKIDEATFIGCTSLEEILIPHSVQSIYERAFDEFNEQDERYLQRIYGSPNTTAESFAQQKGIEFVNIEDIESGDLSGDGNVTLDDYNITKEYLAGNGLTLYSYLAADVNNDGAVDAFDLFEIDKQINLLASPKFTYNVENGLAVITSYIDSAPLMVIPDRIDGYDVIELDTRAFKDNKTITGAIVSGNVATVDNYAFMGCSNLQRVDFGDSLQRINYGAFLNCTSLTQVNLGSGITTIGSYAFKGCSSLASITIPSSVTSINANSFMDCAAGFTIYGETGSFAQTYASNNGYTFVAIS